MHNLRNGILYVEMPSLDTLSYSESGIRTMVGDPDLRQWHVVARNPYGYVYADTAHEAMDATNYNAIQAAICDALNVPTPWHGIETDWPDDGEQVAILGRVLCVHESVRGTVAPIVADLATALDLYPLLNEDAYSEREHDAWLDYAPLAWGDEVRDAERAGRYGDDGTVYAALIEHRYTLLGLVESDLHYHDGFSGEYYPKFLAIMESRTYEELAPIVGPDVAARILRIDTEMNGADDAMA